MFGLLWEWSGRVRVPICHIAPFPGGVKTAFSRGRWGLRHGSAVALPLLVQEIRIGILRLSRIEEGKMCRPFSWSCN